MKSFRFLFAGFLLISNVASAQLAIDRIIVDFSPNTPPREDVRLVNTSDEETIYVQSSVVEVINPGQEDEQRVSPADLSDLGLLVSPERLVLPPGAQQLVRLVSLDPSREQERIFRVDFSPVTGEVEAEETFVKLMVGYEALVIVRPDSPNPDIVSNREGNILSLKNKGNTNVFVDHINYCESDDEESCETISGNRLYADGAWDIELPGDGEIRFNLFDGQNTTTRRL